MKTNIYFLTLLFLIASILGILLAPVSKYTLAMEFSNDDPVVTVLRVTTNADDITDLTVVCIDGIRYVIMPGIGMTVKFKRHRGELLPETCTNKNGDIKS
jgi:hypothetical protein